jgi:hypothetical protein
LKKSNDSEVEITMSDLDDSFLKSLADLVRKTLRGEMSEREASAEMRRVFLWQNSATEYNTECVSHVEIGASEATAGGTNIGLRFRDKNLGLSHVFWSAVESGEVAVLITKQFPALSLNEAAALLRVCSVMLSNLEARLPDSGEGAT